MSDLLEFQAVVSRLTLVLGSKCRSSGKAEVLLRAEPCLQRPHPYIQDYRTLVSDEYCPVLILLSPSFRLE